MNSKKSANSGVWFCKNNENVKRFSNDWNNLQIKYRKNNIGVIKHHSSYSQQSFSFILHEEYKNKTYLNVLPISENIYNYEHDDVNIWINDVNKYNPKILHFKGRKWRNKKALKIFEKLNK
jgi:hypothetical protein